MNRASRRAALVTAALLCASCVSGATPSPTPRDMTAVLEQLALRGATVEQLVAGDAGCPGLALHGNAARLELRLQSDAPAYDVFLFRWRRPDDFERADAEFEACLDEYELSDGRDDVDTLELAPWRAYGPGWSAELRQTVEEALRAAGAREET